MRRLCVIGMGTGDLDGLTVRAVRALQAMDVLFLVDKGDEKRDLNERRGAICERHAPSARFRTVVVPDPERDRGASDYAAAVEAWRQARGELYARVVRDELGPDECGAFLVWGDPSLYDGTLPLLAELRRLGAPEFTYEVVAGVSSVHELAARHGVVLNRVGGAVTITTGRRLAQGLHDADTDIAVMLDANAAFRRFCGRGYEIYWGAYLGLPGELLLAGALDELAGEIEATRAAARDDHGWIMDTYLLRGPAASG